MLQSTSRTIDGIDFEVTPLPAWKALDTSARVMALFSPALGELASVKDDQLGAILRAVTKVAQVDRAEFLSLTKVLFENSTVILDGKKSLLMPVFDMALQGKTLTVYKLFAFALEVNFADFFDLLKGAFASAKLQALGSMFQKGSSASGPVTG